MWHPLREFCYIAVGAKFWYYRISRNEGWNFSGARKPKTQETRQQRNYTYWLFLTGSWVVEQFSWV